MSRISHSYERDPLDLDAIRDREERRAAAEEKAARRERLDVVWLMGSRQGRRFVWRQLEIAGVYRLSHVARDATQTSFHEGERSTGLRLLAVINEECPDQYPLMVKEAADDRDRDAHDAEHE